MSFSWEADWVQIGSRWWSSVNYDQATTGAHLVSGNWYYGTAAISELSAVAALHGARLPNFADMNSVELLGREMASTTGWAADWGEEGLDIYGANVMPKYSLNSSLTLDSWYAYATFLVDYSTEVFSLIPTGPGFWALNSYESGRYASVRFVRDTPPTRSMGYIAGAGISGIEHDLEYTEDRNIRWRDVVGSAPRAIPLFLDDTGGERDYVEASFTAWANSIQSAGLEAMIPPYEDGNAFEMLLPGLPDTPAMPGFGAWDATWQAWRITNCTMIDPMESMGQKGPVTDLYGYRFSVRFPVRGNEHGTISEDVPPCLARKFMAHQIQDWSRSARPLPVPSPTFTGAKHGRRRDGTMSLDHLRADEVESVIGWYRLNRGRSFGLSSIRAFGPGMPDNANALARNIKINRGAGWWWDVELDLTLAY